MWSSIQKPPRLGYVCILNPINLFWKSKMMGAAWPRAMKRRAEAASVTCADVWKILMADLRLAPGSKQELASALWRRFVNPPPRRELPAKAKKLDSPYS